MKFQNEVMNKAIREVITLSNSAVLAIRDQQGAPTPDISPFATVQITLLPPRGWAEIIHKNNISGEDIDEIISERVMCRASVNYFKNDGLYSDAGGITLSAIDAAVELKTFLQGTLANQRLNEDGMGLNRVSEVRNLTALENDEWEERAQLDVDFNVVASRTDLICEIKSVLISGTVQDNENEYTVDTVVDETTLC
jgi:hypothetical protein